MVLDTIFYFLRKETRNPWRIFTAIMLVLGWQFFFFYDFVAPRVLQAAKECAPDSSPYHSWNVLHWLYAGLREEIWYRLPLFVAVFCWGESAAVLAVALGLSIMFGLDHGSWRNIFVQGGVGVLYSILFLKCGGGQGRPLKALVILTLAHAFSNIMSHLRVEYWWTYLTMLVIQGCIFFVLVIKSTSSLRMAKQRIRSVDPQILAAAEERLRAADEEFLAADAALDALESGESAGESGGA